MIVLYICLERCSHRISTKSDGSPEISSLHPGDNLRETEILGSVPELRIPRLNGRFSISPCSNNNDLEPLIFLLDSFVEPELFVNHSSANSYISVSYTHLTLPTTPYV